MRKMTGSTTRLKKSPELEKGLNLIKKELKKHISAFDTKLGLHRHTDASFEGLGFILPQPL